MLLILVLKQRLALEIGFSTEYFGIILSFEWNVNEIPISCEPHSNTHHHFLSSFNGFENPAAVMLAYATIYHSQILKLFHIVYYLFICFVLLLFPSRGIKRKPIFVLNVHRQQ